MKPSSNPTPNTSQAQKAPAELEAEIRRRAYELYEQADEWTDLHQKTGCKRKPKRWGVRSKATVPESHNGNNIFVTKWPNLHRRKAYANRRTVREELYSIFQDAVLENRSPVEVNAGELHTRVGDYPGPNHRMPLCCSVMRRAFDPDAGDVVVEEPPSGKGARLTIRYALPRPEEVTAD